MDKAYQTILIDIHTRLYAAIKELPKCMCIHTETIQMSSTCKESIDMYSLKHLLKVSKGGVRPITTMGENKVIDEMSIWTPFRKYTGETTFHRIMPFIYDMLEAIKSTTPAQCKHNRDRSATIHDQLFYLLEIMALTFNIGGSDTHYKIMGNDVEIMDYSLDAPDYVVNIVTPTDTLHRFSDMQIEYTPNDTNILPTILWEQGYTTEEEYISVSKHIEFLRQHVLVATIYTQINSYVDNDSDDDLNNDNGIVDRWW